MKRNRHLCTLKNQDVNEKALQAVNAYLLSLQRKEQPTAISVNFFTRQSENSSNRNRYKSKC